MHPAESPVIQRELVVRFPRLHFTLHLHQRSIQNVQGCNALPHRVSQIRNHQRVGVALDIPECLHRLLEQIWCHGGVRLIIYQALTPVLPLNLMILVEVNRQHCHRVRDSRHSRVDGFTAGKRVVAPGARCGTQHAPIGRIPRAVCAALGFLFLVLSHCIPSVTNQGCKC